MWLSNYINWFTSSPIATSVLTLAIIAVTVHLVVPSVLGLSNLVVGYWDRFETARTNKYLEWLSHRTSDKDTIFYKGTLLKLVQVKDMKERDILSSARLDEQRWGWYGGCETYNEERGGMDSFARSSNTYSTKEEALQVQFDTEPVPCYLKTLVLLIVGGVAMTLAGRLADWLLFSYFLQTLVVLALLGGVFVVMYGGRFVFDLNKKVEKIDTQEKGDDS